ncbi:MAG: AAA family ATPase [Chitinivibrionales bacterium]|nr:AAA family ATPase [Chitinivibrionales bacterium]
MKNYILDTTVLLYDANALTAFEDNNVYIPINVIEDVDQFKKELSERGRNARHTSRSLDSCRKNGSVARGVPLKNGGRLYVSVGNPDTRPRYHLDLRDKHNHILSIALDIKNNDTSKPTILVTKDINLRIKADALGLEAQDYESDKVDIEELYSGYRTAQVEPGLISRLKEEELVAVPGDFQFYPNEYVQLIDIHNPDRKGYCRFDKALNCLVGVKSECNGNVWRIRPRNQEQIFAMDALLNDSIQMLTLVGKAGTGKTLLAVAASLYKTVDENTFSRILVSRPTQPMGKDIGYLPGGVEQKLFPWMYPIADNVEFLMRAESQTRRHLKGFRELIDMGILIIEPLTYIRGRSIHNQYLIVDEAQNLTPHELKTIITRVGDGTKIVITGDPYQIDNPYIDSSSNGLTFVVERFKSQSIAAHITLTKGERSQLSELAANLL